MKRALENRLDRLEAKITDESAVDATALSEEDWERIDTQIEGILASLDDDQRADLEEIARRIDDEPADAETGPFGLTEAECAFFDVLTGGRS